MGPGSQSIEHENWHGQTELTPVPGAAVIRHIVSLH